MDSSTQTIQANRELGAAGKRRSAFSWYAWGVLAYNLLVIMWGAYVRATGSGAGCGAHWPSCQGQIIPRAPQIETLIEFTHRLSSGLVLVLVGIMAVWAWKAYAKGSVVRLGAGLSLLLTITEALLGAGLVLFELVAHNQSIYRAAAVSLHLVNTLLLIGSITLTAWWSSGGAPIRLKGQGRVGSLLLLALIGLLVLGASGAITALGDTLFPSGSLAEGFSQDLSPTAHFLIRLRVIHPILAVTMSSYLAVMALWLRKKRQNLNLSLFVRLLIGLLVIQLILGAVNVLLLAPVWMQMVHLLVSDLVWIALVLLSASALAASKQLESEKAPLDIG